MDTLGKSVLMNLEQYAQQRDSFRARVMQHKKNRRVAIGPHLALYFEDRLTIQYQVQDMLRIEKIFEGDAIQQELDTYNPLIPDGSNWKATAMGVDHQHYQHQTQLDEAAIQALLRDLDAR